MSYLPHFKHPTWGWGLLTGLLICGCQQESTQPLNEAPASNSKITNQAPPANPLRNVYFGDLHVHSSYSFDSYITFSRVTPEGAYRFAQGERIDIVGAQTKQLDVPLDFAAVTDHAEFLGELSLCLEPNFADYQSATCQLTRNEGFDPKLEQKAFRTLMLPGLISGTPKHLDICGKSGELCLESARSVWQDLVHTADIFNTPGKFTTFAAYEWTGQKGGNWHRNVIFRNNHVPTSAASYIEYSTPESLWLQLSKTCTPPCQVLTISHNSNQSNGTRFNRYDSYGQPYGVKSATLRAKMEPLVEIMQHKGSSECRPGFGTTDEDCGFEKWDRREICGEENDHACAIVCDDTDKPEACVNKNLYVRNALKLGLDLEKKLAVNPFQLGIIASTDTHNGTPGGTAENSFQGNHGYLEATPEMRQQPLPATGSFRQIARNPGGLAAIWAEQNTRDSLFDGLIRRETYGTSGTRIQLRFFASWDFEDRHLRENDLIQTAYHQGVPMGSVLAPKDNNDAPKFLYWAQQAADGAPLQRIQIIKGWLEGGNQKERVYDVACSDGLTPSLDTHKCQDNGAQVNIKNCKISDNLGTSELKGLWTDPHYDPSTSAFYYTRVLENPTCRWSTYDAIALGRDPSKDVPRTIQERAWSSPIWIYPE